MAKIDNYLTYIERKSDKPYLTTPLLNVNMRLFKVSNSYRKLIQHAVDIIVDRLTKKYEDYNKPKGMSGANCAIPFNIIAYHSDKDDITVMINPKIIEYGDEKAVAKSNCGSIRLESSIPVERSTTIKVEWYDINGRRKIKTFDRQQCSFTIQHEIEHNLGILITDKNME